MRTFLISGAIALVSSQSLAQTPDAALARARRAVESVRDLGTPAGHEIGASIGRYDYREPGTQSISIHGAKFGGEYAGTVSVNRRQHWFVQANVRASAGDVTYDGWCSPFLIAPNSSSPNGYELDVGDASPCSESGDKDWYVEARGLFGKDLIGRRMAVSPYTGIGVRELSNGTTGTAGYRTDRYLYLPLGATVRARTSHGPLNITLEYDRLLRGWQKTRDSALGSGDVPPTDSAPGFSVDGFTDIAFSQHSGWAFRLSAKIQLTRHVSLEPYYIRWSLQSSPVSTEFAVFTVNGISAEEQFGAYEPFNVTNEFGVKLGFRFR